MKLEAGKEMDRKCVLDWLNKVYIAPSFAYSEYTDDEIRIFAHDALALLKEQEARILKYNELWNEKAFHAWYEDDTGIFCEVACVEGEYKDFHFNVCVEDTLENEREYIAHWRMWTTKPTEEQRKSAKWDAELTGR